MSAPLASEEAAYSKEIEEEVYVLAMVILLILLHANFCLFSVLFMSLVM